MEKFYRVVKHRLIHTHLSTSSNPSLCPPFQAFLNALADQLQVQPFQIILGRAVQGSILLDTSVVPLVGDKFQIWTAAGIEDVLQGQNGRSLQLNQSDFGTVLVTSVTPPAQLSREWSSVSKLFWPQSSDRCYFAVAPADWSRCQRSGLEGFSSNVFIAYL